MNSRAVFLVNSQAHMNMFTPIIEELKQWNIFIINIGFLPIDSPIPENVSRVPFMNGPFRSPYETLLDINPSILICAIDTTFIAKLFIDKCKQLRIPTLYIQDGMIDFERSKQKTKHLVMLIKYSFRELCDSVYCPKLKFYLLYFLAKAIVFRKCNYLGGAFQGHAGCNKIACFGLSSADGFISEGIPKNRLVIVGSPKFDLILNSTACSSSLRQGMGISTKSKVVLVATQYFVEIGKWRVADRREFIEGILDAIADIEDTICLIKPHPIIEKAETYKEIVSFAGYNVQSRVLNPLLPMERLISMCDLLITTTSTTAVEAMVVNKPTIVFNLTKDKKARKLSEHGVWYAEEVGILKKIVGKVLSDPDCSLRDPNAIECFIRNNVTLNDGMASQKITQLIEQMCTMKL